jgi:predicted lipid-binding transport protein (Tim44 family)
MAATLRFAALLCASALTLSACGTSGNDSSSDFKGEDKAVAQAIEDFQSASRKGDEDKICTDLLAPALVSKIKAASKDTCQDALNDSLQDVDSFQLDVKKVSINGTTATATVESDTGGDKKTTDTLTLTKVGNAWKIAELSAAAAS